MLPATAPEPAECHLPGPHGQKVTQYSARAAAWGRDPRERVGSLGRGAAGPGGRWAWVVETDRRVAGVGLEARAHAGRALSEAGIKDVVGAESSAPHPDSPSPPSSHLSVSLSPSLHPCL